MPRPITLQAYLDESGIHASSPLCVIAGFYGSKAQWEVCLDEWQGVLDSHKRKALHMRELRFKSKTERQLLLDLGPISWKHGLRVIGAFVTKEDHELIVKGRVLPEHSSPYMIAFNKCLFEAVHFCRSKGQRMAFMFERTTHFQRPIAELTELALAVSEVASVKTMPKGSSVAFQLADYIAFQLYQWIQNSDSHRAQWGVSIMGSGLGIGGQADREFLKRLVAVFRAHGAGC